MRKRKREVLLFLNDDELLLLNKKSRESGLSRSEFLRCQIKNGEIKILPQEDLLDIRKQIRGVGRNINQITRLAHISGKVSIETLKDIAAAQEKLEHQLGRLL